MEKVKEGTTRDTDTDTDQDQDQAGCREGDTERYFMSGDGIGRM